MSAVSGKRVAGLTKEFLQRLLELLRSKQHDNDGNRVLLGSRSSEITFFYFTQGGQECATIEQSTLYTEKADFVLHFSDSVMLFAFCYSA